MTTWSIEFKDWAPNEERLRETLCTLGNGYFATRGAGEEAFVSNHRYPGTYLAGGYDRIESEVGDHIIENEDFVNWPNWLCLNFRINDGRWFSPEEVELQKYLQELDIKKGVLRRTIEFRDYGGRNTKIVSERLVSMSQPHLAAIRMQITPLDWSGKMEVWSEIDGRVQNAGVERYNKLNGNHLEVESSGKFNEKTFYLQSRSRQSCIVMVEAARTDVYLESMAIATERNTSSDTFTIGQKIIFEVEKKKTYTVEKIIALHTSKDKAISSPQLEAAKLLRRAPRFSEILRDHEIKWKQLWNRSDIKLIGNLRENKLIRLHIFHLLQTVSMNSIDLDVGVPSRGLHGEAYRGHIFWDELYIFPFLNLRIPELTRSLLLYRYRRLDDARYLAREEGFQGAMFPWQSGSDGEEESQRLHLNPRSGKWIPDTTRLQRHINADIVYNIWQYFQATNDLEFLFMYGAEMALEICRFWFSVAHYNPQKQRYEIKNVVGPDEFHTGHLDAPYDGIDNNSYTNFMASWSMRKSLEIFELLAQDRKDELLEFLRINTGDLQQWKNVSRSLYIEFYGDLIAQFEDYDKLEEINLDHYRRKYGDIHRLDRILDAEGDSANRYKLNKQADVLMLFYLFSTEELKEGFEWLNYKFNPESIPKNIEYYLQRSSNGSTLSHVVHCWVTARVDRLRSWDIFGQALLSDFSDIQGGTTTEGIHLGAMAGTIDIIQRCYTGLEMKDEVLWLNPRLPDGLEEMSMRIRFRGHWLRFKFSHTAMQIKVEKGWMPSGKIGFQGKVYEFREGNEFNFNIAKEKAQRMNNSNLS